MAALIYLDTHLVVWLFAGRTDLVPEPAKRLLDENELLVSPMVELELQYLNEIGRLTEAPQSVMAVLASSLGLKICDLSFAAVVGEALGQNWTRDPFDRIIVAQAVLRKSNLLTRDRTILENFRGARWS